MRIRKLKSSKRQFGIAVCIVLSLLASCTYYTAVSDDVKNFSVENGETFIYVRNQFQFFLREVTVWTLEDFASNSPAERHKMRKFTVGKRIATQDNVLEQYKITLFDNGTAMYKYVLKKIDTVREEDSDCPFMFCLETDTGNVLMTMTKDISEDMFGFKVNIGDETYKLCGIKDKSNQTFAAVFSKTDNDEVLFCMKKNAGYFSDRIEFDINRLNNPVDDVMYVSIAAVCDSVIRKVVGGGYKN